MVSEERIAHILRMEEDAVDFAKIHGVDLERLKVAICAHDLFRDTSDMILIRIAKIWDIPLEKEEQAFPILAHGKVAAEFLRRRFTIKDDEIFNAVAYHTSGCPTRSKIVMSLVVLDTLEHGRKFEGVEELREIAAKSLEKGYEAVIKNKIVYALNRELLVLSESVRTWNYLKGVK